MECEDRALLNQWAARWEDLIEFEIIPVVTSAEAAATVALGCEDDPVNVAPLREKPEDMEGPRPGSVHGTQPGGRQPAW